MSTRKTVIDKALEPLEHATADWWPCACVKGGGNGTPSTHIKLHHPSSRKCRVCGCTKPTATKLAAHA